MRAASLRELLRDHWLMGALAGAPLLLALAPLLAFSAWLLWVFLLQPAYMIHQLEEHVGDRFRTFVNTHVAQGQEALTPAAVAVINIGGVWIVNAAALLLAGLSHPGWGLVAAYLAVVNAVTHIAAGVRFRSYNPGLVTSVALFLPAGIAALILLSREPGVGVAAHLGALALILALHAAIVIHVKRRM
ncbi:HXXEE domain-containing protein [Roseococcus sp. SYP-B2431]|uniref:HXXEE domain-containing protein n=1 Tax=Roseococcus sp. SYP-B2431 TaxID=2496640 RepID=UPI00103F4AA3|nr:HXXEE domain-containing protein [Roseococcus sp. SYP-B2431]TCH96815.1 HXXEE domain-containing protein [Roseococcus sp. SYP-B2431]